MPKLTLAYKTGTTPLFPISIVAENYTLLFKKSIGVDDKFSYVLFIAQNQSYNWFFKESEIESMGDKINRQIIVNGNKYFLKCSRQANKFAEQLFSLTKSIRTPKEKINWDKNKTIKFFLKLFPIYRNYSYYTDTISFSLQMNGLNFFQDKLYKYCKQEKSAKKEYIFNLLTCYTQNTFTKQSDIGLLEISLLVKAKQRQAIKKHCQKYYWLIYDYFGTILNEKYFENRLKELTSKKSRIQIQAQILKWKHEPHAKQEEIKEIIANYKIPNNLADAFQSIRDFAYLYSETKKFVLNKVNIAIRNVLAPLAQERETELLDLYFLNEKELIKFIRGEKITRLNSRKDFSVFLMKNGGYRLLNEQEEKKYLIKIDDFIQTNNIKEIKGQVACKGKVKGKVRLVFNASQISKVEKGDILVAPLTTVSYVPAMEKAGAIITDLGGITSHAAIVSRELKTPCIIGTKVGTMVLRDGQIVEVDANHGIIKIINN